MSTASEWGHVSTELTEPVAIPSDWGYTSVELTEPAPETRVPSAWGFASAVLAEPTGPFFYDGTTIKQLAIHYYDGTTTLTTT